MTARKVPDGWHNYTSFNKPIDGMRVIAIKTPLNERFNTGLSMEEMTRRGLDCGVSLENEFTPTQVKDKLRSKGLKLGLVIDLTNTNRYYNGKTFEEMGVAYYKINCPGHEIPPESVYQKFSEVLSNFLSSDSTAELIAAVHCTHGLNRTGYLICRYLIEYCGLEPELAIKKFNEARGHCIERENYLRHLRRCPLKKAPRSSSAASTKFEKSPSKNQHHSGRSRHREKRIGQHRSFERTRSRDEEPPTDCWSYERGPSFSSVTHHPASSSYTWSHCSDRGLYHDGGRAQRDTDWRSGQTSHQYYSLPGRHFDRRYDDERYYSEEYSRRRLPDDDFSYHRSSYDRPSLDSRRGYPTALRSQMTSYDSWCPQPSFLPARNSHHDRHYNPPRKF